MSKALSVDLRTRVPAALSGGMSGRQAARRFGVGAASAARWRNLERAKGDARPKVQGGDRRSGQTEAHAGEIPRLYEARSGISIEELRAALAETGVAVGHGGLWRFAFETCVEKVLVPELKPGDIVVMDTLQP